MSLSTPPDLRWDGALYARTDAILSGIAPITLAEVGQAELLDRFDSKFLLPLTEIPSLIEWIGPGYRVLEVAGTRASRYSNLYLDTPGRDFYLAHHAGVTPRFKVRIREYVETGTRFLEVKRREASGRTVKVRMPTELGGAGAVVGDGTAVVSALEELLDLRDGHGFSRALRGASLEPTLRVSYRRIALVQEGVGERVTIDLELAHTGVTGEGRGRTPIPGLAIVEVKQAGRAASPVLLALRRRHYRPGSMSKYCLALAEREPELKRNHFKPTFDRVARIARAHAGQG